MNRLSNGLASIIVPCRNQLAFTRECVRAITAHTTPPWELVIVNDGSSDGTATYVDALQDADPKRVIVVSHTASQGFPTSCNHGLNAARGNYLVLLNNDAVVTEGWLDHLIALAESDPKIGLVGPMSNYASPPQLVSGVPYRNVEEMHCFAGQWRRERLGRWFTCEKLSGFCLLMKRNVFEQLGGLDERFGLGFFDDDDLCFRARKAGFELAVAFDCFVHHFGSRTIATLGIDTEALLQTNSERFAEKWGQDALKGRTPVAIKTWAPEDATLTRPPAPTRRTVRVSLTMIVKNEEANLPRCLESVRGLFDEIIVLDTGSTDRTVEIATSFGARVFDFVWVDDFAAARNAALARATGDYAFWLDADDVVEPSEYGMLDRLFAHLQLGDDAAYVIRCACDPDADGGGGATVVDHVRLFPVRENVRWSYRVHEQILPALRRAGIPDRWTDIVIRHTGYTDRALRARKLQRDEKILLEELEERPKDPFVLFNLGSIAIEREDWQAAIHYLEASLAGSAAEDSITRKLYALISRAHQGLGDTLAALAVCGQGLEVDPQDAELWFRKAFVHRQRGEHESAEACWTTILGLRRPTKFSSVDMGIYGHLTHRNLAVLALERGDVAKAIAHWKAVVGERPNDLAALQQIKQLSAPSDGTPQPTVRWVVPGSCRRIVAVSPGQSGEFAPFAELAIAWVRALRARVIVELGARFGETTRVFLEAIAGSDGRVCAVDPYD